MRVGVAFDFDGVLYETYRAAVRVLRGVEEARGLPPYSLLQVEDSLEALGVWDRRPVYGLLVGEPGLHEALWATRVAWGSGSLEAPVRLRGMGLRVYLVCGADATRWEKLRRVEVVGARLVFDDIVVYEPGGLAGALEGLVEREGLEALVYLDDKPGNTCVASSVERVAPVLVRGARPLYPSGFAWRGPHCARLVVEPRVDDIVLGVLDVLSRVV